jgi:hypothetical protein
MMALQLLTASPNLCCPKPLECEGGFSVVRGGKIWESYISVKGTFTFDGSLNSLDAIIKIYLFNGETVIRSLDPGQSFAFTGDQVNRIEISVSNGSSNILFRHCTQILLDTNCKQNHTCCQKSLQCNIPATYGNIPVNEDYLLWKSKVPVNGSLRIGVLSDTFEGEVKIIIKRFNKPNVIETITGNTIIRSSDMEALLVKIPSTQGDPPNISVEFFLSKGTTYTG